jgi:hypothetical protein
MKGTSAGFAFRQPGRCGRFCGNWLRAALIAACTSRAAASMLRFSSNWIRARQHRVDRQRRKLNQWQRRDPQEWKRDRAGYSERRGQQRSRDRPIDEWRRNIHASPGARGFRRVVRAIRSNIR